MIFDPDSIENTHSAIVSGGMDYGLSFRSWDDYPKLQYGLEAIGASGKERAVSEFLTFIKPVYDKGGLGAAVEFCEANKDKIAEFSDVYLDADEDVTGLIENYVESQLNE